jgi:hypothetical protein
MGGGSSRRVSEVFIDFENTKPSDGEIKTYRAVDAVFRESKRVQQLIEDYKGCRELARKAMSTPTKENELAAFEGLLGAVDSIATFFNYTNELARVVPDLMQELCRAPLGERQALATQLALIFQFALVFDQTRMMRPNLSNDFSYYRRLLPKFSKHPDLKVKDDDASGMALFTAEHIPMISALTKALDGIASEEIQLLLASFANSCLRMLKQKKFSNPNTALLTARAMTGAIVLYDRIGPDTVFNKKCPLATREAIILLRKEFPKEGGLTNAIQFSTKHFARAPSGIQDLFE